MRYSGHLYLPCPRSAAGLFLAYELDMTMNDLHRVWWRVTFGGDC